MLRGSLASSCAVRIDLLLAMCSGAIPVVETLINGLIDTVTLWLL